MDYEADQYQVLLFTVPGEGSRLQYLIVKYAARRNHTLMVEGFTGDMGTFNTVNFLLLVELAALTGSMRVIYRGSCFELE